MADDPLTTLLRRYGPYIYARCVRLLGDRSAAEDATQEAFMRVHRHLQKAPDPNQALAWIELGRDQVIAEVTADTHARIAVQPGRYAIRASRDGRLFAGQVEVAIGGVRSVSSDALAPTLVASTTRKGGLAAGGGAGIADDLGVVPGARIELVTGRGLSFALDAGSRAGSGFRETSLRGAIGYRLGLTRGAWSAWAGLEAGGGAVIQSRQHPTAYSGVLSAGGLAGIALEATRRIAIAAAATLPVEWLKRDGKATLILVPAGWLGVAVRL